MNQYNDDWIVCKCIQVHVGKMFVEKVGRRHCFTLKLLPLSLIESNLNDNGFITDFFNCEPNKKGYRVGIESKFARLYRLTIGDVENRRLRHQAQQLLKHFKGKLFRVQWQWYEDGKESYRKAIHTLPLERVVSNNFTINGSKEPVNTLAKQKREIRENENAENRANKGFEHDSYYGENQNESLAVKSCESYGKELVKNCENQNSESNVNQGFDHDSYYAKKPKHDRAKTPPRGCADKQVRQKAGTDYFSNDNDWLNDAPLPELPDEYEEPPLEEPPDDYDDYY